jgi:hypothetical protein
MISAQEFDALVAIYEQHGWVLRQVVVAEKNEVPAELPREVVSRQGIIDAAWFSRPPKLGRLPWEIRYLGPTPYALVEHLDENSDDFEQRLHQTEERLADVVAAKRKA